MSFSYGFKSRLAHQIKRLAALADLFLRAGDLNPEKGAKGRNGWKYGGKNGFTAGRAYSLRYPSPVSRTRLRLVGLTSLFLRTGDLNPEKGAKGRNGWKYGGKNGFTAGRAYSLRYPSSVSRTNLKHIGCS